MSTIRARLTLGLVGALVPLLAAGAAALYLHMRAALQAQLDAALAARARALAAVVVRSDEGVAFDLDGDLRPWSEKPEDPDYFELTSAGGDLIARSRTLGSAPLPREGGALEAPRLWNVSLPGGRSGRAIGVRFVPTWDDEPAPRQAGEAVLLVVAVDRVGVDRPLRLLLSALLVVGLALLGCVALVVSRIVRRGLAPLDRLAAQAGRIDAASLGTRFPGQGLPGELRPICAALDELLERLERTFERERRFTADAAHELRTPIAELRALAEVNLRFPGDERATARAFRESVEIARQMEGLVAALLHLARSDAGAIRPAREPVALADVAGEAWRDLEGPAREKRLDVVWRCESAAEVSTDRALTRAVLGNLLSNAVEYAPPGGRVEVRIEPVPGGVLAMIGNTNDALVPEDLPHLFERFWRKDGARSPSGHAGLGLPVVAALARLLDVDVRVDLPAPSWFRVQLRFPAAGGPGPASLTRPDAVLSSST